MTSKYYLVKITEPSEAKPHYDVSVWPANCDHYRPIKPIAAFTSDTAEDLEIELGGVFWHELTTGESR